MSFEVFGTLVCVRESAYAAFKRILAADGARDISVKLFWERWEHQNTRQYWGPYRAYRALGTIAIYRSCRGKAARADRRLDQPAARCSRSIGSAPGLHFSGYRIARGSCRHLKFQATAQRPRCAAPEREAARLRARPRELL